MGCERCPAMPLLEEMKRTLDMIAKKDGINLVDEKELALIEAAHGNPQRLKKLLEKESTEA